MLPSDSRLSPLRDLLVGKVLRGSGSVSYHLLERIGEGGQGWVFKAGWDEPGGLVVIVKVLRPDTLRGEGLLRFQREANVLRLLSQQAAPNPHIVRFFDHAVMRMHFPPAGDVPIELPFTVLEYVNGPTLDQVLREARGRGLASARVRRIVRQVVLALEAVHRHKVVHRDLKPSNVLLSSEGGTEVAKVTDFGLVKLVDASLQRTTTLAGASLGYAPPEQYEQGNERVTPRTDVFSLAAITFEMIAGRAAFPYKPGENPLLIVTRILNGPRPELTLWGASLDPELAARLDLVAALDTQLARALSADPADRHESVHDLWVALDPLLREVSAGAPAPSSKRPSIGEEASRVAVSHRPPAPRAHPVADGGSSAPPQRYTPSAPPSPREAEVVTANPAAWAWQITSPPRAPGTFRAGLFSPNGEHLLAVGPQGLLRLQREGWVPLARLDHLDLRRVLGLSWLAGGDLLLFGEQALAVRVAPSGESSALEAADPEVTFLGGSSGPDEVTTLVGRRPQANAPSSTRLASAQSTAVVAQYSGHRLAASHDVEGCSRLRGATRLAGGSWVACGDWGSLVRIEETGVQSLGAICGGHLAAVAPLPDGGAVTIGAGGHALSLSSRLEAHLEAVQTTRDLLSLTVGEDGAAWAGSAQARLLRRSHGPHGGNGAWVRMSGDLGVTSAVIALAASARHVRAVCDDGAVIEGRLA